MPTKYYLAIDIGASSGRHIIGYKDNKGEIQLEELYRFPNWVKEVGDHLIWDIENLVFHVKAGIKECLKKYPNIESLSIDTWGVDYVLLDEHDQEILPVYAYRDTRTVASSKEVHKIIPFKELYQLTGIQFQTYNSIYQLFDDKKNGRLAKANDYLMIPEYLMFKLTGKKKKEFTNASTMGMCDWNHRCVSKEICDRLGYPEFVSQKLYYPGEVLGELSEQVQAEVGGNIKVVLCATHDTASAVEAIDMPDDAVYVSSGTWALFGIRSHELIVSKEGFEANYSNEYGPNYIRYLTNLMGMWMVNSLSKQLNISVIDLVKLAQTSTYVEIIDVNDQRFVSSTDMINEINGYLKDHNQPLPNSDADLINLVYHSLAYSYNKALEQLEKITNRKFKSIYIVGGGAKNLYLNKLVEKYTNRKVVALPIEATSIGNIKVQMEADK